MGFPEGGITLQILNSDDVNSPISRSQKTFTSRNAAFHEFWTEAAGPTGIHRKKDSLLG